MDDGDIIGEATEAELDVAIRGMFDRAVAAGLPSEVVGRLSAVVHEYKDVWRVKLMRDPPIKVKPDSTPYRCAPRRYNELSRKFMREFTQQLEAVGFIFVLIRERLSVQRHIRYRSQRVSE